MNNSIGLFKYLVLLPALVLWCSNTSAYEVCKTFRGKDIKWKTAEAAYFINSSGGPSESVSAIEAGMQTWTDVASSNFSFVYGGTTTNTAHGTSDGYNIVTFGLLEVGTVAENRYWYNVPTGRLLDSDIRFNTYYSWSTTGTTGTFDVQNVGSHEHGHSLCLMDLYHSADSEKTMYGYVSYGETGKRSLHQDDIDGITYLYTCPTLSVRIVGVSTVYYATLQAAYDDAEDGATIQIQGLVFNDPLYIDMNKAVALEGGYGCVYASNPGISVINDIIISDGLLTIQGGTVEVR